MIKDYLKENKNVIIFFILFAVAWNIFVIGVCHLIPARMRNSGWFIAPTYQAASTQKTVGDKTP